MLENMVALNRESLIDSVEKLTEAEARQRLVPSLTTPLGLVNHVAAAERSWFQRRAAALPEDEWAGHAYGADARLAVPDEDTIAPAIRHPTTAPAHIATTPAPPPPTLPPHHN